MHIIVKWQNWTNNKIWRRKTCNDWKL